MFGEKDMKMGLGKSSPGPHDGYKVQLRSGILATPPPPCIHLDPWAHLWGWWGGGVGGEAWPALQLFPPLFRHCTESGEEGQLEVRKGV